MLTEPVERFTITAANSGTVSLKWDKTEADFTVK